MLDYRCVQPYPVSAVLGIEPGTVCSGQAPYNSYSLNPQTSLEGWSWWRMAGERGIGEAMPAGCFEVMGLPACGLWSRIYLSSKRPLRMRPGAKTRLSVCEEFSERLVTRCEEASKAVFSLRVGPLSMYLSVPLQHPSMDVW